MGLLFMLFVGVPIAEIALFIYVGGRIGLLPTLVIIVLTAVAGSMLVARQGAGAIQQVQQAVFQARFPGKELAHGLMIAIAGTLLITPGFLTDGIGFALLVPPIREVVRRWVGRRYRERWTITSGPPQTEGEWQEPDPPEFLG